jgi:hypothetical protein
MRPKCGRSSMLGGEICPPSTSGATTSSTSPFQRLQSVARALAWDSASGPGWSARCCRSKSTPLFPKLPGPQSGSRGRGTRGRMGGSRQIVGVLLKKYVGAQGTCRRVGIRSGYSRGALGTPATFVKAVNRGCNTKDGNSTLSTSWGAPGPPRSCLHLTRPSKSRRKLVGGRRAGVRGRFLIIRRGERGGQGRQP